MDFDPPDGAGPPPPRFIRRATLARNDMHFHAGADQATRKLVRPRTAVLVRGAEVLMDIDEPQLATLSANVDAITSGRPHRL